MFDDRYKLNLLGISNGYWYKVYTIADEYIGMVGCNTKGKWTFTWNSITNDSSKFLFKTVYEACENLLELYNRTRS